MPEAPSPYTPLLNALIELSRHEFVSWKKRLLEDVVKIVGDSGQSMPLNDAARSKLARVLTEYREQLRWRLTGTLSDPATLEAMLRLPGFAAITAQQNPVNMAYRLGASWNPAKLPDPVPHTLEATVVKERIRDAIKVTMRQDFSEVREASAMAARRSAGTLITKVGNQAGGILAGKIDRAEQAWTDAQLMPVRQTAERAVREKWSRYQFKRELWDAISDSKEPGVKDLTNNLDRIAVTELQRAFCQGAVDGLLQDGGSDVQVFVVASKDACVECKRIWGLMPDPNVYRLGDIIANGDNRGVKQKDWRAIVGPIHPQCLCSAPMIYKPHIAKAVASAHAKWLKMDAEDAARKAEEAKKAENPTA